MLLEKILSLAKITLSLYIYRERESSSSNSISYGKNEALFKMACIKKGKLNLGCGSTFHESWVQLDFASSNPDVYTHNLLNGIPCDNDTLDVVYHSHVLEHFSKNNGLNFIKECYRILKPKGIIRIAVPDLEQIVKIYLEKLQARNEDDYNWILLEMYDQCVRNTSGGEMLKYFKQEQIPNLNFVLSRIGNEGEDLLENYKTYSPQENTTTQQIGEFRLGGEIHQWMYDKFSLELLLKAVGFSEFTVQEANTSFIEDYNEYQFDFINEKIRKPDSLFVEARK